MAQANLISMAATARHQASRRGEQGLMEHAKTVVEVKKMPLVAFKLCTNRKVNLFGSKIACQQILSEHPGLATTVQNLQD